MNIRCHGCNRQFRVRHDRLPAGGARTRCPRCGEVLVIPPQAAGRETPPEREPGSPPPADGDLFELPPADLQPLEQDPVFTGQEAEPGAGDGQGRTGEAEHRPAPPLAMSEDPGPQPDPALPDPVPARRGGLRGWLSRLFGRDS